MKTFPLKPILLATLMAAAGATTTLAHAASDADFVKNAAIGGMTEVEASKTAQTQATNAEVKQFAERMVQDHTKANDQLKQVAEKDGISVPDSIDKSHQKAVDKLAKKSAGDFDKAYMDMMVSDHKKTISLFEKEAKSGKDAGVKAFASDTLPTLKEHLKMAQDTTKAMKTAAK